MIDNGRKKRIAILYICTGDYIVFWRLFYRSFKLHFMKNSIVDYYVFTDADGLEYGDNNDVFITNVESPQWPYSTLMRFHFFCSIETQLKDYDYIFYFNANSICIRDISEEELLPEDKGIVVVEHPGFLMDSLANGEEDTKKAFLYERNKESLAYIPFGKEEKYVCGGVNGGSSIEYIAMMRQLSEQIDEDLKKDIIAIYHDESHLNKYISTSSNFSIKTPEYAYPEGWILPIQQKIVLINKNYVLTSFHSEDVSFEKKEMIKYTQLFGMSRQLFAAKNKEITVGDYLFDHGYRRVVIYGCRNFGEILINEIQHDTRIDIAFLIDNFVTSSVYNVPVYRANQISTVNKVDAVIVTAIPSFYSIYRELIDTCDCPIISAEYIVHDMYYLSLKQGG